MWTHVWFQLENVKETETYKKAKEILERFAPEKTQTLEVTLQNCTAMVIQLAAVTLLVSIDAAVNQFSSYKTLTIGLNIDYGYFHKIISIN